MKVLASPAFGSLNPYCNQLYDAMEKKGVQVIEFEWRRGPIKCDIFHIHWPDLALHARSWGWALYRCVRLLLYILVVRARGGRLVWTAHNLQSHENYHPRLERVFWWAFIRQLDGVISLSNTGLQQVLHARMGSRKVATAQIGLGHYRDIYENKVSVEQARDRLAISPSAFVVGWVGQIRTYKGLTELMDVWRKYPIADKVLLIAGHSPEKSLQEDLEKTAAQDASIRFQHGRVADEDLQYYLNASDVIVMPYRKILNSSTALLGLSFQRPVVLPRSGIMEELQSLAGSDWVYLYDGEFGVTVLQDVFQWMQQRPRSATVCLDRLNWDSLADQTLQFFQQVLDRRSTVSTPPV